MRISLLARCAGALGAILLTGCNIHPDVLDVTDLPVFDIVHRIECEAADAVRITYVQRDFVTQKPRLMQLETEIGNLQDELKGYRMGLEFGSREELADAIDSVDIQIQQLQAKIAKLLASSPNPPGGASKDDADDHYAQALLVEGSRLLRQQQGLASQKVKLEAALDADSRLKAKIKQRNRYADLIAYEGHVLVLQFLFQITENNNAVSTGSLAWPIALGTLTLGYDVGERKKRMGVRNVRLALKFRDLLHDLKCDALKPPRSELTAIKYPIAGIIGLADVIDDYLRAAATGKFKAGGESYTDRIQFTTKINGSLKPKVDIARKVGQVIRIEGELTADREDLHELTVYLSPVEQGGGGASSPTEVVIKKMPDLRARSLDVQPPL